MFRRLFQRFASTARGPRPGAHRRRLSCIEDLEPRALLSGGAPTVYSVDSLSDTGTGSGTAGDLRYCVTQANANLNQAGSVIQFDSTVFNVSLLESIVVRNPLDLTGTAGPITIDGPAGTVTSASQIEGPFEDAVGVSGANAVTPFDIGPGVTATFSGLVVLDGLSPANGGAILNAGSLSLDDCVIGDSNAAGSGGGIQNNGSVTLTDCFVANNTAQAGGGSGGGIANNGSLTISDSLIVSNTVTGAGGFGGGIDNAGTLDVQSSLIESNSVAGGYGGGICNTGTGTVDISSSVIGDNSTGSSSGAGAGILNVGHLAVVDSEIDGNTTGGDGGGIGNLFGAIFIGYCTVAGNSAGIQGGGIANGGTMQAVNVTIADNSVATAGGGGGVYSGTSSTTLDNTIVAQNTADTGASPEPADDIAGSVSQSSAFNLIGTGGAGGLTNGVSGNQVGVASDDVGLADLSENGGLTETIALSPVSPAIDAGGNIPAVDPISGQSLTTDQRGPGFARALNGGIDIGAYELQPGTVSTVSVRWGSSGLATLQTASDGLRLLPAGRHTDLPWTGIKGLIITFNEPVELVAADVTVASLRGVSYGPVTVKGPFYATGSTGLLLDGAPAEDEYDILFAQPIDEPDRITITITSAVGVTFLGEAGIVPYTRRLDVLPGDFYDTGVVTNKDLTTIRNEATGKHGAQPTIFGEILGDATVTTADYRAARKFLGARLPKLPTSGGKRKKIAFVHRAVRQQAPASRHSSPVLFREGFSHDSPRPARIDKEP
jgi:hypothetical protein